jgi:hypothetical protein
VKTECNGTGRASVQRAAQKDLTQQAIELDREIKAAVDGVRRSLTDLGRLLARMKESRLWEHVPGQFRGWEDYMRSVLGSRAHSSLYEAVAAFSLTEGSNPIPLEEVNRMGIKKSAQVARLKPEQRTPEIIQAAVSEPLLSVRNRIQATLNETLPPTEQKPILKLLAINLPEQYVDDFEDLMEIMHYMEGIRDGDRTLTMRSKAFHAMLVATHHYWGPELAQAMILKRRKEALDKSQAATAQGDLPDEDQDDVFPDNGQAHL